MDNIDDVALDCDDDDDLEECDDNVEFPDVCGYLWYGTDAYLFTDAHQIV